MWQQIELHSIQTNMQRAGRQAKKDNTNGAKSSKGSASANQNVININLGDLTERGERKRSRAKKKDDRPPKKPRATKAEPTKKKPTTKPDVARLVDLKKQYTELTRSVDMRMIPEGCRDVPDRLLTPTTPEQVRELMRYLEDCIRKIRLTSSRGMIPPSGISVSPTPGMPPPPPPGAGGIRLPGAPDPMGFYGASTYAQQLAEQQRREKEEKERKEKEEKERKERKERKEPSTDTQETPEKPLKDDASPDTSQDTSQDTPEVVTVTRAFKPYPITSCLVWMRGKL